MEAHQVVTQNEWIAARKALMAKEKAMTHLRDQINKERRALPWVKIEKNYVFDTPQGKRSLSDLFEGRSQLLVKHFMLAPGQSEPCTGCSFEVDHIEGALQHIERHDVKFVSIARAPIAEIEAMKKRMGWHFTWVSSFASDFNYDFDVSFKPEQLEKGEAVYNYEKGDFGIEDLSGLSVFYKNEKGEIFHTYSVFGRGGEEVISSYMLLDMTPKGRNESGPNFNLTDWVRPHDRYDDAGAVDSHGRRNAITEGDACCASVKA